MLVITPIFDYRSLVVAVLQNFVQKLSTKSDLVLDDEYQNKNRAMLFATLFLIVCCFLKCIEEMV